MPAGYILIHVFSLKNRASSGDELYIYGGMDFEKTQGWHIPRKDVILESLLKNGHFANIYKTTLKGNKAHKTVVAKILKGNTYEKMPM